MAQCFESVFYSSRDPSTLTWLSAPTLGQLQLPVTAVLGGLLLSSVLHVCVCVNCIVGNRTNGLVLAEQILYP